MRTFLAIEIPDNLKTLIRTEQERLHERVADVNAAQILRWTNPDKLHLTVRFLGETSRSQLQRLEEQLSGLTAACWPIPLELSGLGCFVSWKVLRVLWMGVAGDVATLTNLHERIEGLIRELDFSPETRPYTPHITLARTARDGPSARHTAAGKALRKAAAERKNGPPLGEWTARDLLLMRSVLHKDGAQYSVLKRFPLGEAPAA